MKIAILSFYSGINLRGVERWTKEVASRLTEKHDITVFQNERVDNKAKYKIVTLGLPYEEKRNESLLPLQKRAFLDYKSRKIAIFALKLLPELWRGNFDVVIPTDGGWEPAFIRILTWVRRKKMVIVGHAGIGWDDKNNLWSFPDCFVGLSTYARKWAKKVNPFIKSEYIPDGVDIEKFKPTGEKIDVGLQRPRVLVVGAFEKTKRIDLSIKAVSKIKNVSLMVIGRGELKEELNELGRNLLAKRFKLASYDFTDMPRVYRSCDVLVSTSLQSYSFEMVLLEAMASNIPVVANNDPIRQEIVGSAGILANPLDAKGFAGAIRLALQKKWENKPRKQAEKFSWDKVTRQYDNLFQSLIQ